MKKGMNLILFLIVLFCIGFNSVSAADLMINPQEFYDKFCRIARETYGGKFCTSQLTSISSGYAFQTVGGYTIGLKSTSLKKDISLAVLQMPLSANLKSKEALTAMYSHFLTADNNIFASEETFSVLDKYVQSISLNLGKKLKYDRIQIYSEKTASGYQMQAYR